MANCKNQNYVGREVVLEAVIACGDTLPQENEWRRVGSMRTKEFNLEWETTDATADDSVGALRANLATFQTLSISGEGISRVSGEGSELLIELTKHVARPDATGGQPVVWLRMTFPDLTFTAFMIISNMSRSAPLEDVVTFSLEASATASDFGLIVEDTPDPDAAAPTSVEIIPASLDLIVGQAFDAQGIALPPGTSQDLRWTSSNTAVATVNLLTGQVSAVGEGSATITAASAVAPAVTDTISVTVTPQVQSLAIAPSPVSVQEGATQQLTITPTPAGASDEVNYASANPAVATVNASGLVTGVAAGSTTITATSKVRPSIAATVAVTVTEP